MNKIILIVLIHLSLFGCASSTLSVGEYVFDDGTIWVNVTTDAGFGSQLEVAKQLFKERALQLCAGRAYSENDITELNSPSGYLPPGGELGNAHQISTRSGFITCESE